MKTNFKAVLVIIALPTLAFADPAPLLDLNQRILSHPVVVAMGSLLQEKYQGSCSLPSTENDVHWMCFGLRPQVTSREVIRSGCGFDLEITCTGGGARIFGFDSTYSAVTPKGPAKGFSPVDDVIEIENVTLTSTSPQ